MWEFNWGIFWAILAAGAVLGVVNFVAHSLLETAQFLQRLDSIEDKLDAILVRDHADEDSV